MTRFFVLTFTLASLVVGQVSVSLNITDPLPAAAGRAQIPSVTMGITVTHPPDIVVYFGSAQPEFVWSGSRYVLTLTTFAALPGSTNTQTVIPVATYLPRVGSGGAGTPTGVLSSTNNRWNSRDPLVGWDQNISFYVRVLGQDEFVGYVYRTYASIYNNLEWPNHTLDLTFTGTSLSGVYTDYNVQWTRSGNAWPTGGTNPSSSYYEGTLWRLVVYNSTGPWSFTDPFTGVTIPLAIDSWMMASLENTNTSPFVNNFDSVAWYDTNGTVAFRVPPPWVGAGLSLNAACALIYAHDDGYGGIDFVELAGCSNAVSFTL